MRLFHEVQAIHTPMLVNIVCTLRIGLRNIKQTTNNVRRYATTILWHMMIPEYKTAAQSTVSNLVSEVCFVKSVILLSDPKLARSSRDFLERLPQIINQRCVLKTGIDNSDHNSPRHNGNRITTTQIAPTLPSPHTSTAGRSFFHRPYSFPASAQWSIRTFAIRPTVRAKEETWIQCCKSSNVHAFHQPSRLHQRRSSRT